MADKTWKSAERKIAKLLGGEREPVSGRQRGYKADVAHDTLSIEVKHWQKLPNWLHDAMAQAEASKKGKQFPAVILHEKGMDYEDCFTILRLSDIIELLEVYGADADIPLNM